LKENLDGIKMEEFLGNLLRTNGKDLYRMKGILCLQGVDDKLVIQGVHHNIDLQPHGKWKEDEKRINKIVFIGHDLPRNELLNNLYSCLVKKEER